MLAPGICCSMLSKFCSIPGKFCWCHSTDLVTLLQHGANLVLLLLEFAMNQMPYEPYLLGWTGLYSSSFALWAFSYYKATNRWMYPVRLPGCMTWMACRSCMMRLQLLILLYIGCWGQGASAKTMLLHAPAQHLNVQEAEPDSGFRHTLWLAAPAPAVMLPIMACLPRCLSCLPAVRPVRPRDV